MLLVRNFLESLQIDVKFGSKFSKGVYAVHLCDKIIDVEVGKQINNQYLDT